MSRSALHIAETAVQDFWEIQCAFNHIHALFTLMMRYFPEGHTAHAFAELGIAETNDWSLKVLQWTMCMEDELEQVSAGGVQ